MDMKDEIIKGLQAFIDQSPSPYHAIAQIQKRLMEKGFIQLFENEIWMLHPGKKYYVIRNDSSVMAFVLPEKQVKGFHIFASHSDSPSFRIKSLPEMEIEDQYVKMNVEKYGGMILSTWLDRPLSVAGRIMLKKEDNQNSGDEIESVLVNIDENLCVIPNVAVHLNPEINKGMVYNPQIDLLPLISVTEKEEKFSLRTLLAEKTGVEENRILSSELYLYNRDKACLAGVKKELIMAPRLDDLECVYSGLEGFLATEPDSYINILAVFHNEEVGSLTRQGADSTFLKDTLSNIVEGMEHKNFLPETDKGKVSVEKMLRMLLNKSFMLSADNAHALHPNHPDKADPTNKPVLNQGIVLKFHGSQKYATDAYSEGVVRMLAQEDDIPVQTYCNRSDLAGGSTLGNIAMAHVSIPAADIGLAQLAMHSACETAGSKDVEYMIRFAKQFFEQ